MQKVSTVLAHTLPAFFTTVVWPEDYPRTVPGT